MDEPASNSDQIPDWGGDHSQGEFSREVILSVVHLRTILELAMDGINSINARPDVILFEGDSQSRFRRSLHRFAEASRALVSLFSVGQKEPSS